MGEIVSESEHAAAVSAIRTFFELCPDAKADLLHHLNNSLSTILLSADMSLEAFDDPESKESIRKHLYRIKQATEHMCADIREISE